MNKPTYSSPLDPELAEMLLGMSVTRRHRPARTRTSEKAVRVKGRSYKVRKKKRSR